MAASGLIPALGTLFTGGVGSTIIGSVAAGIGSAMMARQQFKEEEKMRRKENERREAKYKGLGQAGRFWEQQPITTSQTATIDPSVQPMKSATTPVGKPEPTNRVGEQYMAAKVPMPGAGKRYTYEPGKGIKYG